VGSCVGYPVSPTPQSSALHRRSIRLKEYDYSRPGWYFVTICTNNLECTLGKIVNHVMVHSNTANIVKECWEGLPTRFPSVELDDAVIMPNHMHGIIILNEPRITPGKVIRAFKARAARLVRQGGYSSFQWQRNYYEHVIRNDADLHRIRTYIQNNSLQWAIDKENPTNI
jgi:putative transposase